MSSLIELSKLFPVDIEQILSQRNLNIKGDIDQFLTLANIYADENLLPPGDIILVKSPYFEQSLRNKSFKKITYAVLNGYERLVESLKTENELLKRQSSETEDIPISGIKNIDVTIKKMINDSSVLLNTSECSGSVTVDNLNELYLYMKVIIQI